MSAFCIARLVQGSRLFGTANADSDTDVTSVWLPEARDILLGRIDWTVFANDSSRRNTSEDIDHKQHDLARFLKMVSEGHPMAAEMIFAPDESFAEPPHQIWASVRALAPYIIPDDVSKYMGLIEHQSASFGIGGEKYEAVSRVLDLLTKEKARTPKCSVADIADAVVDVAASRHVRIDVRADGERLLLIAGRSVHLGNRISDAHRLAWTFVESFNSKARKLSTVDRRDWRAVSHAVRLADEALELSSSGFITLPRPNAEELSEIKAGAMSVPDVAERIATIIPAVAEAQKRSPLPSIPDLAAIEDLVVDAHSRQIVADFGDRAGLNLS